MADIDEQIGELEGIKAYLNNKRTFLQKAAYPDALLDGLHERLPCLN